MLEPEVLTVLKAVDRHPALMSPIMLEYMLRGETIGRMEEKGLIGSPFHGALAEAPPGVVAGAVATALTCRWVARAGGFYPALRLTTAGEVQLLGHEGICREAAPDHAFQAYHRWRVRVARRLRKPPYRILPNAILTSLAARRPHSLHQLLEIPGLGKRRALRYQTELLAVGASLRDEQSR
ncbi:MAG: HRDC domain-containing protein [Candidatus Sericytochromatia bacterium]|nr:HRDC domain-containing protein [Candidatus Sericytochromatia bacterium]